MTARTATIVVASTRASAGTYPDRSGPILAQWLTSRGWAEPRVVVVPDGEQIGVAIAAAIGAGHDLVLTSGGTGASPTDLTPEQTAPLLDRELTGLAEHLRREGARDTPHAVLSRGLAGIAGGTVVINLPGSPTAAQTATRVLDQVLEHLLDQVRGIDHARPPAPSASLTAMPTEPVPTEPAPTEPVPSNPALAEPVPTDRVLIAELSPQPLSVQRCAEAVSGPDRGAVVTFSGVVRNHDSGRAVTSLTYHAHPEAEAFLQQVSADVAAVHPEVRLAVVHRLGPLAVGDVALACAVASAHRGAAFAGCQALVDAVKERVPIWKEQTFADGTTEWVGSPEATP